MLKAEAEGRSVPVAEPRRRQILDVLAGERLPQRLDRRLEVVRQVVEVGQRVDERAAIAAISISGALPDRTTGAGTESWLSTQLTDETQKLFDASASGPFELLGRRHDLVVGLNTARVHNEASYQRGVTAALSTSDGAIALVERGLMTREGNPGDRRSHLLKLTQAGRELYAAIAPKALDLERRIFESFSAEELDGFVAMLRRIDAVTLALGEG